MEIESESALLEKVESLIHEHYDAIVVEGADGVGKGRVLNLLSDYLGVTPYRPDYNLWQRYDHRNIDRWKISGFFWDVWSHFNMHGDRIMLFDRGVLSGAVYNNDIRIALDYKNLLGDMKVFHILVMCDIEDFEKFQYMRTSEDVNIRELLATYHDTTLKFIEALNLSDVEYATYMNHYDTSIADGLAKFCEGCGHYNYGWCRHPRKNMRVNPSQLRCEYSNDKEVQDTDVTEMHCL